MFSKNWKKKQPRGQRSSGAGGARASRRKNRQTAANRNEFHFLPQIESLEPRMLLTGSGLDYSPEFIQYMDQNNLWGSPGYPDCRLPPDASTYQTESLQPRSNSLLPLTPNTPPIPKGASATDTSSYALGTMTWNIIFVSTISDTPSPEVWTVDPAAIPPVDEIAPMKQAVTAAKNFWESQTANYVPGAQLKIDVKYLTDYGNARDDVAVDWYPVSDKSEVWMNDVMAQVHLPGVDGSYNSTNRFQNVLDFDNDTRLLNNTNWSVTVFYLHDATELANGAPYPGYGYAYLGGPYTVMTQDFASAITHEMGHIFNALDEYHNSGAAYHDFGGYLWYKNLNCQDEPAGSLRPITVPWPDALMLDNALYLSPPSKHMVGHWDSDYDKIPDILDTLPTVTANTAGSDTAAGKLTISGTCAVTVLPNMSGGVAHDGITITTITQAYYRLNGGEEVFIPAGDGAYDGYSEAFNFTLNGLLKGNYVVDIYTVNSVGNVSQAAHLTFTSTLTGPDLIISKTHTGDFTQGQTDATYTLKVTNAGTDGSTTTGLVYVVDTLPAGLTAVAMSGAGWSVDLTDPKKPKARRSDPLTKNSSYPLLTLTVSVARDVTITAPYTVTNLAVVSGGGEVNTLNDTTLDPTVIDPPADLTVKVVHDNVFTQGDRGRTYTITISNASPGTSIGQVTVADTLPAGLRVMGMSGTGWTVDPVTLTATRSDALVGYASYPALTLTVAVDLNAAPQLMNVVTVSGGQEAITNNDTFNDPTDIGRFLPLITVPGSFTAGTSTLSINFNRAMTNAGDASNFELRDAGPDELLGTADDIVYPITASYFNQTTTLNFPGPVEGLYRLTLRGTIADSTGYLLDGNSDGIPGGDWSVDFVAVPGGELLAPATTFSSGGLNPLGIAAGDFNRDGKSDLVVANSGSNSIQVLLATGRYSFTPGNSYFSGYSNSASSAVPYAVIAKDLDGDGKLDLAVANYDAIKDTGTVQIFRGNGDGTFIPGSSYTWANCSPVSLAAADFNNDGKLDLVVANYNSGKITILTGAGDGTFSGFTNYISGGLNPTDVAVADFNGDGKIDIAVTNEDNHSVGVFLNNGNGTFPASGVTYLSGGTHPKGLAVGDFNNDGKPDIAVANYGTVGGNDGGIGILFNNGKGAFPLQNIPYISDGAQPFGITAVDLNGDGLQDIAVTNSDSHSVCALLSDGAGFFSAPKTYGTYNSYGPSGIAVGDFNADGSVDLAVTNTNTFGSSNTVSIIGGIGGMSPLVLNTPNNFTFDISRGAYGPGQFIQGTSNAFDGYGRLMVGGSLFQPPTASFTTADNGRTVISATESVNNLNVNRRITVPNTGSQDFARTVDIFSNPTTSPISTTVKIFSNLGSDASTAIFATSSGDLTLTPDDQWFGTSGGLTPALIHYLHNANGLKPTSTTINGDQIVWEYAITVPAGQSVELAYFTIQAATTTQAINEVNALADANGFLNSAGMGFSTADLAALANFRFNNAPTDIHLSNGSVPEHQPSGTVVGSFSTVDPDAGNTFTYQLVSGTGSSDNGSFAIDGNTLKTTASFDYKTKNSYNIRIRATDQEGLYVERQFTITVINSPQPMVVVPDDIYPLFTQYLTVTLDNDGNVHVYQTGTTFDLVPSQPLASISSLSITGRDGLDDVVTVDFSNGNPIPAGGMTFDGGSGGGNTLIMAGGSEADSVTMTAANISANGSAPISYTRAANVLFALGGGINNLTLDHATYNLPQNNAISAGTKVTVDGGVLNYNGHSDSIGNLTLKNGGHVTATSIVNQTTTVTSGTLNAGSINSDTLIIGGSGASGASQSPAVTVTPASTVAPAPTVVPAATVAVSYPVVSSAPIVAPASSHVETAADNNAVPSGNVEPAVTAVTAEEVRNIPSAAEVVRPVAVPTVAAILPTTTIADTALAVTVAPATVAPAIGELALIGGIANRNSSIEAPSLLMQPSVILTELPFAQPSHKLIWQDPTLLQNRLHDAIFEQMFGKQPAANASTYEDSVSTDLEEAIDVHQTAQNQRQAMLALDSLFSEG